jgi:cytosine/adenosine deaminase-related metal-dependent hydrolase
VVVHRVRAAWTPVGLRADVVVEVDEGGVIVALRPARAGDPAPLDGLLVPGLVNAHVHLELSDRRGQVPGGEGLVPWVGALVGLGRPDDAQRAAAATAGAREAAGFGTAAVSDISNGGDTAPALREAGLAGLVHHEVLGFGRERQEAVLAAASAGAVRAGRVVTRPSPHAVYSTPPAAIRAASVPRGGGPASIHLAEDPGEAELLADGTGPFSDLLERIGVDWRWWTPPGLSPAAYLDALGVLGPGLLCVHGVHLDAADRALLAARGAPLCLCPRSNLHIGGRLPDVPALLGAGVTLVLGTDSLASCPDLDLLAEVAVLLEAFPDVSPEVWLHAATAGGADALGLAGLGRLAVGAAPGLLLLEGVHALDDLTQVPPRRWL